MRSAPRPLDLARDRAALLQLWEVTLGATWPVHADALIAATPLGYVFETPDQLVGAIAFDESGAISYVIVDPSWRRQGIGRALHDAVVDHFRTPPQWHLGGQRSIWPGAPTDLLDADPFFTALGWVMGHTVVDMSMPTSDFRLDPEIPARMAAAGVRFDHAKEGDANDVIAYESREHPVWVPYFRARFPDEPGSVLLARDRGRTIVGALLIDLPPRHRGRWSRILGEDMAEIGCVGVAAANNNQGIGTALVAEATSIVKKAGAPVAFLAWTSRITFYERLGYTVWREYRTGTRPLG
ncbi:MAG: GNAT family N-acetyltransferase [Chloroflexi bacterium]|nr:MAG: GNAT family N-acetyltransferase [Chloroflexota bacterium]